MIIFLIKLQFTQNIETNKWLEYYKMKKSSGSTSFERLFDLMVDFGNIYMGKTRLEKLFKLEIEWIKNQKYWTKSLDENLMEKSSIIVDEDFLKKRITDVGCDAYFYQIKVFAGLDEPEFQYLDRDENWKAFHFYNGKWIFTTNDIFSLKKETFTDEYQRNSIYLKMKNEHLCPQEAFEKIENEMIDCEEKAKCLANCLKELLNEKVNFYADCLIKLHTAAIYWQSKSIRYSIFY